MRHDVKPAWVLVLALSGCATGRCEAPSYFDSRVAARDHAGLLECLGSPHSYQREEAAFALGRAPGPGDDALEARLLDPGEARWVRAAAAQALGARGVEAALPALEGVLAREGTAVEVQLAAIEAICALPIPASQAKAAVQARARSDDLVVAALVARRAGGACGR